MKWYWWAAGVGGLAATGVALAALRKGGGGAQPPTDGGLYTLHLYLSEAGTNLYIENQVATVVVDGANTWRTTTDYDGRADVRVAAGSHIVKVSVEGFFDAEFPVKVVGDFAVEVPMHRKL